MTTIVNKEDNAIIGRSKNGLILKYDKSILITSDIVKSNSESEVLSIELDEIENKITSLSKDVLIASMDNNNDPYSVVYGERLLELLRFIIRVLKTHTHPPNNIPINTFFTEADDWNSKMESYLLNKHVKTR